MGENGGEAAVTEDFRAVLERVVFDPTVGKVEFEHKATGVLCRAWTPEAIFASAIAPTVEAALRVVADALVTKRARLAAAPAPAPAEAEAGSGG